MTDQEMLKAMQSMLQPINDRLDKMDSRLDSMDSRLNSMEQGLEDVKVLATKTQIILENDIARKINSLYEGHQLNTEKLEVVMDKLDDIETSILANEIITKKNLKEIVELRRRPV